MKFENITLETWNSVHRYLISGDIIFQYDEKLRAIKIEITLEMPIVTPGEIGRINVYGIELSCDMVSIVNNKIYGIIEQVDSQQYKHEYKQI